MFLQLRADDVDQQRQAVNDGALTEAAFTEACLAYETFVIDQYRAGLTKEQIQDLAPVGLLVLQTRTSQIPQSCASVGEIVSVLETPLPPE